MLWFLFGKLVFKQTMYTFKYILISYCVPLYTYIYKQVYYFGMQDAYNVMVMDLLGPSLEDLFTKCNRQLSLKTGMYIHIYIFTQSYPSFHS